MVVKQVNIHCVADTASYTTHRAPHHSMRRLLRPAEGAWGTGECLVA